MSCNAKKKISCQGHIRGLGDNVEMLKFLNSKKGLSSLVQRVANDTKFINRKT